MVYFKIRTIIELYPDIIPVRWVEQWGFYNHDIRDAILDVCGDLLCIYRDPEEFRKYAKIWFFQGYDYWFKIAQTYRLQYDPIANYDRKETVTDRSTIKSSGTNNSENNSVERVSAFNSDSMTDKQSGTFNGTTSGNMDVEKTDTRTVEIKGNIGVTTTQDMIKQERELWKYRLSMDIAEQFKQRFCIMVY